MNVHFREEQRFRQPWLLALLVFPLLPILHGAYQQSAMGRRPGAAFAVFPALYIAFLIWFLSVTLVTEVRDQELYVKFLRLWPARRIPLDQIRRVAALTYRPIADYGGWGVRRGMKGVAYNVSGNQGVLLELADGRSVLVGSQRAEELARAIEDRQALLYSR